MSGNSGFRVSWLVSAHNADETLERCLRSIAAQTVADFEAVVVDDGSVDSTSDVIRAFGAADPRFRLVRLEENHGLTRALNAGLEACTGRYIARLDADDAALPDRLERQLPIAERQGSRPVLIGSWARWKRDGRTAEIRVPREHAVIVGELARHNCFVHSSMFFTNTSALRYDPRFRMAQDYALALRALRIGAYLANVEAVTVVRYDDEKTLSRTREVEQARYAAVARALHRDPRLGESFEALLDSDAVARTARDMQLRAEVARHLAFGTRRGARDAAVRHIQTFGPSPYMAATLGRTFLPSFR